MHREIKIPTAASAAMAAQLSATASVRAAFSRRRPQGQDDIWGNDRAWAEWRNPDKNKWVGITVQ
jgi:hypothetical protein